MVLDNHDKESFRRLTKVQPVGLKYGGIVLSLMREVTDALGNTIEVVVSALPLTEHNKPKDFIHWVSHPITAEDALGNTIEVVVSALPLTEHNKPKAFIHWVSHPITAEVRLYDLKTKRQRDYLQPLLLLGTLQMLSTKKRNYQFVDPRINKVTVRLTCGHKL
ncbi:hypothetical protein DICVIV_13380 [Dictyocaulus viviparus]|uniref:Glutamyl/glutaminyl-tRNA synthetase class Ib anti-codon binding domain-containing protein n=1 Tax=Dictyocaulus viviparus TaxID=29172 RepID=A0A0D8X7W8_DICVI|nr:hypothetical protein DICVIV_13380 [Dictyocaulus viviparus]